MGLQPQGWIQVKAAHAPVTGVMAGTTRTPLSPWIRRTRVIPWARASARQAVQRLVRDTARRGTPAQKWRHELNQDPRIDPTRLKLETMRSHGFSDPAINRPEVIVERDVAETDNPVDPRQERGREAGIEQDLEALDVQPIRVALAPGQLGDRIAGQLRCDQEGGSSNRNGLALGTAQDARAPGPQTGGR